MDPLADEFFLRLPRAISLRNDLGPIHTHTTLSRQSGKLVVGLIYILFYRVKWL